MQEKLIINKSGESFSSNKNEAIELAHKSNFGELKGEKVIYSPYEVAYLVETKKVEVVFKNKKVKIEEIIKKINKETYLVFKDLRTKGHILKEGLKFGTDFRVYEKGEKPGLNHAKYLVYILNSNKKIDPRQLTAKARIAHSTNKTLLIAIIDSEQDISYYTLNWKSKD